MTMKNRILKSMPLGLSICLAINVTVGVFVLLREEWALYAMAAVLLATMSAAVISVYGLFEKPKEPESTTRIQIDPVVVKEKAEILRVYTHYEVGTVLEPEKFRVVVAPEVNGCEGCYFQSDDRDCCNMLCDGIIYKQISEDENNV